MGSRLAHRFVPIALASGVCLSAGCVPGLSEPERFRSSDACDYDVLESLLIPRCAHSGCHDSETAADGLEFLTGGLAERIVGVESITCSSRPLIDPRDPRASYLLEHLVPEPTCAGRPVPRTHTEGALSDQEFECLGRWVEALARSDASDAGVRIDKLVREP